MPRLSPVARRLLVGCLSVVLVISTGWLANALEGQCLFKDLPFAGPCTPNSLEPWCRGLIPLLLTIVALAALYELAKGFVPLRHLAYNNQVSSHKVLIAALSPFNPAPTFKDEAQTQLVLTRTDGENTIEVPLTGQLQDDIKAITDRFNDPAKPFFWRGQQFLRALAPHVGKQRNGLEKLILIGSPEPGGSHKNIEAANRLARHYLPRADIQSNLYAVDFENISMIQNTLDKWIKQLLDDGYHESDIIIDTTGGMKTTSIAGALTTLRWSDVEFQYVQTLGDDPKAISFNVVIDTPPKDAG